MDQGQRQFLLLDIQTSWLSGVLASSIVEQVVLDLEGDTGEFAECAHAFHFVRCCTTGSGTAGATGSDQTGRFLPDDVEVDVFLEVQPARFLQLKEFAFAHFTNGATNNAQ